MDNHKVEDIETIWEEYSRTVIMIEEEINKINSISNPYERKYRFNFLYLYYRDFEKTLYNLTPYISEAKWEEIEGIRDRCERLRKLYGDKHNIRDIEP